jgi:hypothetical protein
MTIKMALTLFVLESKQIKIITNNNWILIVFCQIYQIT